MLNIAKEHNISYNIHSACPFDEQYIFGGSILKGFFSQYSYGMVKMLVNQLAISIFGGVLAMATSAAGNDTLTLVVSIFAVLFYLFLLYNMTWEIGAKDKISVDVGKKPYRPYVGVVMAVIANIPNLIIALAYAIGSTFATVNGNVAAISKLIAMVAEGMYFGAISVIKIGDTAIHHYWWTYFLMTVPAIVTSTVAYLLGHRNFRFVAGYINKKLDNSNKH